MALFCSPRVFAEQLPALWALGPVSVADHRRDDSIEAMARRLLADSPPRFGLVGISMGGYVALEVLRQAPQRVARLGLLCTSARPDTPEQAEKRKAQIELAKQGHLDHVVQQAARSLLDASRSDEDPLFEVIRTMGHETGDHAFIRQQTAIMGRIDSRPSLAAIECPTLVLAAENDQLIPSAFSNEMAEAIPKARVVQIRQCGHLATLDRPHEVNRALLASWQQFAETGSH